GRCGVASARSALRVGYAAALVGFARSIGAAHRVALAVKVVRCAAAQNDSEAGSPDHFPLRWWTMATRIAPATSAIAPVATTATPAISKLRAAVPCERYWSRLEDPPR